MRVPHTINKNTLLAYGPSEEARNADHGRSLRGEDTEWDRGLVPSLAHLCIRTLPAILAPCLPSAARDYMLEILPVNLPLPLATKVIQDGEYWRRRTLAQWKTPGNIQDGGGSCKRYYLEKYAQQFVESLPPQGYVLEELTALCNLVSDFVYRLDLRQLQVQRRFLEEEDDGIDEDPRDRIDLKPLIIGLKNLTELHIQFGVRDVGINYRKVLLQFTAQDCRNIGLGVAEASVLRLLRIHHSELDDNKLIALLSQMQVNTSLEALNFSHCHLGDEGAAAIAKFLSGHPKLRKLDISNNKIGDIGVKALAFVLTQQDGCGLTEMNLRLNSFGDSGAKYLLSALTRKAPAIRILNLSCVGLGEDSGLLLGEVLSRNSSLVDVDVSNNNLGQEAGHAILRGMTVNTMLQFLDLRMTGVTKEVQLELERLLHANRCRDRPRDDGEDAFLPDP